MEMKRVTVILPEQLHDLLRKVSYEQGIHNNSEVVREALTKYFRQLGYEVPEFDIERGGWRGDSDDD